MNEWLAKDFDALNKKYRAGQMSKELNSDAESLFKKALSYYRDGNIPAQDFYKVLRTFVITFETREYYLQILPEMFDFFLELLPQFLEEINLTGKTTNPKEIFKTKLTLISRHCAGSIDLNDPQDFNRLGTETILMLICGINCLYRRYEDERGLEAINQLLKLIKILNDSKTKAAATVPSSLYGLAKYFEGKFNFAYGNYAEAKRSFAESAENYRLKILFTIGPDDRDFDTRMLSARRYALARILGSGYLCQTQGHLKESLHHCREAEPFLKNTGSVMQAYASMISHGTIRGLHSHDLATLKICQGALEKCLNVFNSEVKDSHYPLRCKLEISLVKLFSANLDQTNNSMQFTEALILINEVLESPICKIDGNKNLNTRLRAEALSLKSYAFRKLPESEKRKENLEESIKLAQEATALSANLKLLHCDCLLTLGLAYRDLLEYYQKKIEEFPPAEYRKNKNLRKLIIDNQQLAQEKFLLAESLNRNVNQRIAAVALLRLSEMTLIHDHNYLQASYYYEKYKAFKIEHRYVLDFADRLEKSIREEERKYPIFTVNATESLSFVKWSNDLRDFLVDRAVYQYAQECNGVLPFKLTKGDKSIDKRSDIIPPISEFLHNEVRISQDLSEAYAKKKVEDFKRICEELNPAKEKNTAHDKSARKKRSK